MTSSTNTATYGYVSNAALVGSVTFKQGGITRLTTVKTYDNLNRLASINSQVSGLSSQVSAAYTYNNANQRTRATREDNAYWQYEYDALGQVIVGRKHLPTDAIINGLDFGWSFDDIGNRRTATVNSQLSTYSANLLNQYSSRTVPGVIEVMGAAQADATVTVMSPATDGTVLPTLRQSELYTRQLTVDNGTAAQYASVKVTGVKNNVGPNGEDAVTEETRRVLVAGTPEVFTHDADGNLTNDARWHYTWDGENRLIAMETSATAVTAGVTMQSLAFAYDAQGRRVAKSVTHYPEPALSPVQAAYHNADGSTGLPSGPALATETVPTWDFVWSGAPAPGVPASPWAAEITGTVTVPTTGNYTITVTQGPAQDACRLFVNGNLVLNLFNFAGPRTGQVTLSLAAGQAHQLRVQFYTVDSESSLQLRVAAAFANETVTTRNLYDGWNLLAEVGTSGSLVRSYTWGLDLSGSMQGAGGVGGLLFASYTLNLTPYSAAAAFDGNGNVIGYVDMATGAKSATYEYNAFGETLIADGVAAEAMPFRFSTKYTDPETGLLYYGLRYYSPSIGRWINRDPIGENGGLGLYTIVRNNPISRRDYLGLQMDRRFSRDAMFEDDWSKLDQGPPFLDNGADTTSGVPIICELVAEHEKGKNIPLLGAIFDSCKCRKICIYECERATAYMKRKKLTPINDAIAADRGGNVVVRFEPVPGGPGSFRAVYYLETEELIQIGKNVGFRVLRVKGDCGVDCPKNQILYVPPASGLRYDGELFYNPNPWLVPSGRETGGKRG